MAGLQVASRRLPGTARGVAFYKALSPPHGTEAMGETLRWDNPGSRLLPSHRDAMLRSGSPPGLGYATPCSLRGNENGNETLDKNTPRPICVRMNSFRRRVWVRLPNKPDPTTAPARRKPKP